MKKTWHSLAAVCLALGCSSGGGQKTGGAAAPAATGTDQSSSTGTNGAASAGTSSKTGGSTGSGGGALAINPSPIYSGFNGRDKYQAPVIATGAQGAVTWKADRQDLVTLAPNDDGTMMITTKGAGTVKLTATDASGGSTTATLTINSYTTGDWDSGKQRYTTQITGETQPCSACHGPNKAAADHTPTQIDSDDDNTVQNSYTTGVNPDGVPINGGNHKWKVSNPKGILSYIRSLTPKGYPTGP